MEMTTQIKAKLQNYYLDAGKANIKLTVGFTTTNAEEFKPEYSEASALIFDMDGLIRAVSDLVVDQEYTFNLKVKVNQNPEGAPDIHYYLIGWSR